MNDAGEKLKEITRLLLATELDYSIVRNACASLAALFCELTGFEFDSKENQEHIYTYAGLAVSPYAAAFCITDMMRTRSFLLGIKEAIDTKLKENNGHPVTVLYAGTGPFASLLTPLTTVFTPSQLQLVLLDINPISINFLQKLIQQLKLQPYIIDVLQTDALKYIIPEQHQPDILVSETMKPGLQKEPQVSIVVNLLPQCNRNPFLIPELIKVEACLVGNRIKYPDAVKCLKSLLELDTETARQIKIFPDDVPVISKGIAITIEEQPMSSFSKLVLYTTVKVFNSHWLHYNETSLTIPHHLMDLAAIKKYPAHLLFKYIMEKEPGFLLSVL
jgi:predicted RNA methylase